MIYMDSEYFNVNRILLLAIGLWPYHQSKLVRFQVITFLVILTSVIVFQFTTFITTKCTADLVTRVLSSTSFFSIYIIKYNSFFINLHNVKTILEQLQNISNELRDENEIAIIENYWSKAKYYTTRLTMLSIFCFFIVALQPIWRIFGVLVFLNESQLYATIQLVTEYFVNEEKHFYLILLHINIAFCIGSITLIATGSTLILCIIHACGMFSIASYRIEQAMEIPQNIDFKNEIVICKEIIYAVDIHRKAIKFSRLLISTFERSFLVLMAVIIICLTLNLFRISQIVSFGGDVEEVLLHLVFVIGVFTYMFLANYIAQEIMDHNNHVFVTVYSVQWYIAPLHIQRMILFLLQRSAKVFTLNIGILFTGSLETFCMMVNVSLSYFAVLHSVTNSR